MRCLDNFQPCKCQQTVVSQNTITSSPWPIDFRVVLWKNQTENWRNIKLERQKMSRCNIHGLQKPTLPTLILPIGFSSLFFSSFIVLLSYEIFCHDCLPCLLLSVLLFPAPLIHLYNISSVTITAEHILLWWYQSFRSVAFGLSKTAAQPQTLVLLEVAVDIKTLKLSKAAVSPPCCVVCVCVFRVMQIQPQCVCSRSHCFK